MNLYIDSLPDTTVNMSTELDSYIIDAASNTTYDYNLPPVISNGQRYTLTRIDGSTGVVNLNGTMNINGTSISSFKIFPLSTVSVVSLDGVWYIVCSESISPELSNLVFSAYYNLDINTPYVVFSSGVAIARFPFLGRNNYATISKIVMVFGIPTSSNITMQLRSTSGALSIVFPIPSGSTFVVHNFSPGQKSNLPADPNPIAMVTNNSNVAVSSVHVYA